MEFYRVRTGIDVPSIKIKGTVLGYKFETEKEYVESDYQNKNTRS